MEPEEKKQIQAAKSNLELDMVESFRQALQSQTQLQSQLFQNTLEDLVENQKRISQIKEEENNIHAKQFREYYIERIQLEEKMRKDEVEHLRKMYKDDLTSEKVIKFSVKQIVTICITALTLISVVSTFFVNYSLLTHSVEKLKTDQDSTIKILQGIRTELSNHNEMILFLLKRDTIAYTQFLRDREFRQSTSSK